MEKFGCIKFISLIRQFHDDMHARVLDDGGSSNVFQVTNGDKQGCFLALMLFSMMFSAIPTVASAKISKPDKRSAIGLMANSSIYEGSRPRQRIQ
jgi:hypothetical protein